MATDKDKDDGNAGGSRDPVSFSMIGAEKAAAERLAAKVGGTFSAMADELLGRWCDAWEARERRSRRSAAALESVAGNARLSGLTVERLSAAAPGLGLPSRRTLIPLLLAAAAGDSRLLAALEEARALGEELRKGRT